MPSDPPSAPEELHEKLVGTTLDGRYRLLRLIGRGGMGAVYEAVEEGLQRRVAVKVLHPLLMADRAPLKRFEREARTAAALNHPNVVQVTDFRSEGERVVYLVMELLEGRTLFALLHEQGPMPSDRVVPIALQILSALEAVHAAGLVHRDLKPGNVMVRTVQGLGDLVKVVDFGLARMTEGPGYTRLTQTGKIIGTPAYMAPEQVDGRGAESRSDLYAVGVILYQLLSGQSPFRAASSTDLLLQVLREPAPRLETVRRGVPRPLSEIVARSLAKEPDQRFASAREMAAALESWCVDGEGRTATADGMPAAPVEESFGPGTPGTLNLRPPHHGVPETPVSNPTPPTLPGVRSHPDTLAQTPANPSPPPGTSPPLQTAVSHPPGPSSPPSTRSSVRPSSRPRAVGLWILVGGGGLAIASIAILALVALGIWRWGSAPRGGVTSAGSPSDPLPVSAVPGAARPSLAEMNRMRMHDVRRLAARDLPSSYAGHALSRVVGDGLRSDGTVDLSSPAGTWAMTFTDGVTGISVGYVRGLGDAPEPVVGNAVDGTGFAPLHNPSALPDTDEVLGMYAAEPSCRGIPPENIVYYPIEGDRTQVTLRVGFTIVVHPDGRRQVTRLCDE